MIARIGVQSHPLYTQSEVEHSFDGNTSPRYPCSTRTGSRITDRDELPGVSNLCARGHVLAASDAGGDS